jgi:integrase
MRLTMTPTGIRARHSRACAAPSGPCSCKPSWEAFVYAKRDGRKLRKTFPTLAAAKSWRADATAAVGRGRLRAPQPTTLREAAVAWLEGARSGVIQTRSGRPYKPAAIRSYEASLKRHVLDELGGAKLADVQRGDVQALIDRMRASGAKPSTVRNTTNAIRAIYRRAIEDGAVAINPTSNLRLPAVVSNRERVAEPDEARALLAALPETDRPLWACAFFAGLRRGELQGLRWEDVGLASGTIRIRQTWDAKEGAILPKSDAGARSLTMASVVREALIEHGLRCASTEGLVFGRTPETPFVPSTVRGRALRAWKAETDRIKAKDPTAAGLAPIGLHEARHSFASMLIAAEVDPKTISRLMGHSSVAFTLDQYAKVFARHERSMVDRLDAYLGDQMTILSTYPQGTS